MYRRNDIQNRTSRQAVGSDRHGNNYLPSIDKYSSWSKVARLDNLSSDNTITYMKSKFSGYGIPEKVLGNNGPQFASKSFKEFSKENVFSILATRQCIHNQMDWLKGVSIGYM